MRFVVDKVALEHIFLRIRRFSPVSMNPPILHTHRHLRVALTRRTNERRLETFRKVMLFRKSGRTLAFFSLLKGLIGLNLIRLRGPNYRHLKSFFETGSQCGAIVYYSAVHWGSNGKIPRSFVPEFGYTEYR